MRFTVREPVTRIIFNKAVVICVFFVAAMAGLFYVLYTSRPQEPGTLQTLFMVAAAAPLVGIVIAILSLIVTMVKRARAVASIKDTVYIRATQTRFPAEDLAFVQTFSRNGKNYATLAPRVPQGTQAQYTFEFPATSPKQVRHLVAELQRHRPDVHIDRRGSVEN